jgi:dienelactone hydrolase
MCRETALMAAASIRSLLRPALFLTMAVSGLCDASGADKDEAPPFPECRFLKTDKGIPFAILGERPAAPSPTLFVFGGDMRSSLVSEDVNRLGRLLIPQGYLCVSLDVPCHGTDRRDGEIGGDLAAWKNRVLKGENIVAGFNETFSRVLDYLVAEKFTDPAQIAVSGTSRGGFFAFHVAASDPRVKQVLAFAPVTHLPALAEFKGAEQNELALALSPIHVAEKLVGKPMWIVIGNSDGRVSTDDCLSLGLEVIRKSKGKLNPIPVEVRLVGTTAHRLHAAPAAEYGQLCAPHDEAARWLLLQRKAKSP